jgi:hypothetical protein
VAILTSSVCVTLLSMVSKPGRSTCATLRISARGNGVSGSSTSISKLTVTLPPAGTVMSPRSSTPELPAPPADWELSVAATDTLTLRRVPPGAFSK